MYFAPQNLETWFGFVFPGPIRRDVRATMGVRRRGGETSI